MSFRIKVTTEDLIAKAGIVREKVTAMQTQADEAQTLIDNTASYWLGTAGDKKRRDFVKKKKAADEVIRRISEYPEDLMEMAGIYETAEKTNADAPASLPVDFIL